MRLLLLLVLWPLLVLVVIYVRAVLIRWGNFRRRAAVTPDYLHIRQLERDLDMPLTPFPDWLGEVRVPDEIARIWDLPNPVISWAVAAEKYEQAAVPLPAGGKGVADALNTANGQLQSAADDLGIAETVDNIRPPVDEYGSSYPRIVPLEWSDEAFAMVPVTEQIQQGER